jgi:hypothetical protein
MKQLSIIILLVFSCFLSLKAQDSSVENKKGQQLSEMLKGTYNQFFNLEEKSRETTEEEIKIHYNTGGFQEYVDIYITIDKNEKIIATELQVNRDWMKGINLGFAKDVIKSFIAEFALDKKHSKPLVDKIWHFGSDEEPELNNENLQGCFDTFVGKSMSFDYKHKEQNIKYNNLKKDGGGYLFVVKMSK